MARAVGVLDGWWAEAYDGTNGWAIDGAVFISVIATSSPSSFDAAHDLGQAAGIKRVRDVHLEPDAVDRDATADQFRGERAKRRENRQ